MSASLLSLQFIEAFACVLCVLALAELLEQALEQRDSLRFLIGSGEAFRQIEIDLVAAAEFGVVLEDAAEARNRARAPAHAEIVETHTKFRAAQPVTRFTPFHAYLWRQRAVGVSIEKRLEFSQCRNGLGLIAFGCTHLQEVAHRQFVLRVVRPLMPRIERQELAILIRGQHQRLRTLLAEEAVANAELGIRPHRTLWVVVHNLTEVLAGIQPLLLFEGCVAAVE